MLKSCGCSYGACFCGVRTLTDEEKSEEEVKKELLEEVDKYKFTAVFKDLCGDARVHAIYPARYFTRDAWKSAFIRWNNEPCPVKVIEIAHRLHDKYKNKEYYSPKLLKQAIQSLIWSGNFTDTDTEGLDKYFTDLFAYDIIETRTEWK